MTMNRKSFDKMCDIIDALREEFKLRFGPCTILDWNASDEGMIAFAEQLCKEAREQGCKMSKSMYSPDFNAALTCIMHAKWGTYPK
jgi:hypothetical protein